MPNKIFNTRIRNKRDTAANWETVASTFQPLDGEMIIVYTADGATRFKVGRYDSVKGRLLYYNELPFTDESLGNKIYTQNEEPVDAADGALWVDLDEISSSPSIIPRPTVSDNGKYLGCENGSAVWKPVSRRVTPSSRNSSPSAAILSICALYLSTSHSSAPPLRR